ncbi:hypothetical protein D3C78_1061490 [compost metagenome]
MVEAEGQCHHRSYYNFTVFNNWFFTDTASTQDRNFRIVDNWSKEHTASGTDVRDGNGAAFHFCCRQFTFTTTKSQVTDCFCDHPDALTISIFDNWNDQTVVSVRSNTDIVMFLVYNFIVNFID